MPLVMAAHVGQLEIFNLLKEQKIHVMCSYLLFHFGNCMLQAGNQSTVGTTVYCI